MDNRKAFEEWLLALDEDYPDSDILDSVGGVYFYTTTKALYRQFSEIADLAARAEKAEAQLPEGMKNCTITFHECVVGHGWLSATNWEPQTCPTCRWKKAEADIGAMTETNFTLCEALEAAEEELMKHREKSSAVAVPDGWHPIETAPKDNKRPLLLAQFSESGELHGLDWDGSWEPESESCEIPQVYYVWMTAMNYVDEPTHWMYQPDWFAAAPKQEG